MALTVDCLTKDYEGVAVLRGVSLEVRAGSVHALLGPNGAGKSTIIKCLNGAVEPSGGTIALDGEALKDMSPASARKYGIATIHQNLSLVDSLSIKDNLFLSRDFGANLWLNGKAERAEADELLLRFGLDMKSSALVGALSSGSRQLVEVAKAWAQGHVKVLILDEPTASLSSEESETLFREIERIKAQGVCVIYVTHRLGEVFRISDEITVIRDGEVILHDETARLSPHDLISALTGSSAGMPSRQKIVVTAGAEEMLRVDQLQGPRFGPVSFSAKRGEIVGLYGAIGSGRTSMLETLAGRYEPSGGEVFIANRQLRARSIRPIQKAGLVLVPGDRNRQGLWTSLSASLNVVLPHSPRLSRRGLRSSGREYELFESVVENLDVTPPDPNIPVANLSGGNAQKILIGRWLAVASRLRVLLLDEPASGVDIGSREQIHEAVRQASRDGLTVLVCSSDAEEIVRLTQRVLVFVDGLIVNELRDNQVEESALLAAAHQFASLDEPATVVELAKNE